MSLNLTAVNLPDPDAFQIAATVATAILLYIAVVKALVPLWNWFRNGAGWVGDLLAVIRGRKARVDRVTGEHRKEVPSLVTALVEIREDLAEQSKSINELTSVVTQVADQQATLNEHTKQISDLRLGFAIHAEQIGLLKSAADERIAAHEETAEMWRAVANKDIPDVEATE